MSTALDADAVAPTAPLLAASTFSLQSLRLFLILVCLISLWNAKKLFFESRGWSHRVVGAAHLACIVYGSLAVVSPTDGGQDGHGYSNGGAYTQSSSWSHRCLLYDAILGILGTTATLTAARDFPHRTVKNAPGQSGTLAQHAMVTQGEMIEHAFYQGLNLIQAVYLHGVTWWWGLPELELRPVRGGRPLSLWRSSLLDSIIWRLLAVLGATSPWWARRCFPVHSFSANWKKECCPSSLGSDDRRKKAEAITHANGTMTMAATEWLETRLYQIKKWQYVFYKHVILHGINISVAFPSHVGRTTSTQKELPPLPLTKSWRIFWLALNASYVMEFFLQSLVKRGFLSQKGMLRLQRLLMAAASVSATVAVWGRVRVEVAIMSIVLNFTNRGRDVGNVMLVAVFAAIS